MQKGQIVANEFVLQRLIESDETREIWRALDLGVGKIVCLHYLAERFEHDATLIADLRLAFGFLKTFSHSRAIPFERMIEMPDGELVLTSRHADGIPLRDYAEQWSKAEGRFPFNLVFDVFRPVAELLDNAAKAGLHHGSLSPQAIVIDPKEGVQIQDFELPEILFRRLGPDIAFLSAERFRFFAPEQIKTPRPKVDPAKTDQYSLAMIVAEILAMRPLFGASEIRDLKRQIVSAPIPKIPELTDQAQDSLARALNKDPQCRFDSCMQLLDAMAGLLPVMSSTEKLQALQTNPQTKIQTKDKNGDSPKKIEIVLKHDSSKPGKPTEKSAIQSKVAVGEVTHSAVSKTVSSEQILRAGRSLKPGKIARTIYKERLMKKWFLIWNILVVIACLVAAYIFRDHIVRLWQRPIPTTVRQGTGGDELSSGNSRKSGRRDGQITTKKSVDDTGSKRQRREKSVDFSDDAKQSSFAIKGLDIDDSPTDEVRFVGISKSGRKILFLVDASKFMKGGKRSPWTYACDELAHSFKDLNNTQFFQVIYFNDSAHYVNDEARPDAVADTELNAVSVDWMEASEETKKATYNLLKKFVPIGERNLAGTLEKAVHMQPDVVFLLTDQRDGATASSELAAVMSEIQGLVINVVEIGEGPDGNRQSALKKLADTTKGEYRWINANLHGLTR